MPHLSDVLVHRDRTIAGHEERTLVADVYCPEPPIAIGMAETTVSPAAKPTRPLVVYVYDGAWETGSAGQFARWAFDAADGGFVATEVSYRLGHEAPFPARVEDVCEGIDQLTDHAGEFGIDTDVVAVVGHSAEAHLTLLATLSDGELGRRTDIDTMVGVSGVYDLRADDHEYAGESLSLFKSRSSAVGLRQCPPITYVDNDTGVDADVSPTLLLHGSEDPVVAPDQSVRLTNMLEGVGTQAEYDAVDATDHIFSHPSYHYPAV